MTHECPKPFRLNIWYGMVCVTCGELALTQHALHGDLLVLLVHHLLVAPVTHTSMSCMDCMYVCMDTSISCMDYVWRSNISLSSVRVCQLFSLSWPSHFTSYSCSLLPVRRDSSSCIHTVSQWLALALIYHRFKYLHDAGLLLLGLLSERLELLLGHGVGVLLGHFLVHAAAVAPHDVLHRSHVQVVLCATYIQYIQSSKVNNVSCKRHTLLSMHRLMYRCGRKRAGRRMRRAG